MRRLDIVLRLNRQSNLEKIKQKMHEYSNKVQDLNKLAHFLSLLYKLKPYLDISEMSAILAGIKIQPIQ